MLVIQVFSKLALSSVKSIPEAERVQNAPSQLPCDKAAFFETTTLSMAKNPPQTGSFAETSSASASVSVSKVLVTLDGTEGNFDQNEITETTQNINC